MTTFLKEVPRYNRKLRINCGTQFCWTHKHLRVNTEWRASSKAFNVKPFSFLICSVGQLYELMSANIGHKNIPKYHRNLSDAVAELDSLAN